MRKQIQKQLLRLLPIQFIRKSLSLRQDYRISKHAGVAPGTLIYTGKNVDEPIEFTLYQYSEGEFQNRTFDKVSEVLAEIDPEQANWINVSAIHDTSVVQEIGDHFKLHLLVTEDILNTILSPQYENYDGYLFITLKMLNFNKETHYIEREHISFILTPQVLISFQEHRKDVFDPVRERLEVAKGRIRKRGVDYLLYALMDVIVDNYYTVIEEYNEQFILLEDNIVRNPTQEAMERITFYNRNVVELRKSILPLRDALNKLINDESFVEQASLRFFQDVYSHLDQAINTMETQREILNGLMNLYMSMLSNKMNNVMKTLTIIATIFIPLTFVAGIYGMNFQYMPELAWKWGYPTVMGSMLVAGLLMYIWMRTKQWF
ncbi:magnesium/cobalt transporter CorA [Tunicatimonas pelagia]|uniref:magnesium/cobalt transporter CorA n=1 Tax=Tunicatimonas pelagia TaxID=931531 RepID=UPI002665DD32|nr:magnesium/cobalt transporter CorA [Tunicatimonas pelagia]WKN46059.1 magnesium/cobalt transporter CorA [Tunicatimonas pelagia]